MNSELFLILSYFTYGFSVCPFLLIGYLFLNKRHINPLLSYIAIIEFIIGTSSIFLNLIGLGDFQEQYLIYNLFGIGLWSFLLVKINSNKKSNYILFCLLIIIFFLSTVYHSARIIEFTAIILQLVLGIILLFSSLLNYQDKNISVFFIASIGIIAYSFIVANFFIFKSKIVELNIADFSKLWMIHQVAAMLYYTLLSISIWKSQEI
jgi:hypothetical protein